MSIWATVNAIAPVFLIITAGYVLYQTKVVGADIWSAIEHILFYLVFPALIVKTLARADLGDLPIAAFATVILTAIFGMAALMLAARPLFRRWYHVSGASFTSLFQGATRFHGFMALAIVGALYGDDGLTLCAIALGIMIPLLNAMNVVVLTVYAVDDRAVQIREIALRVIQNPFITACALGFVFNITGLPDFIYNAISITGDGGLGLGLLAVGAGLSLSEATQTRGLVVFGVLIRLVGMPLIMIAVASLVGLTGMPRTIAIIAGAVPTASTAYVMARKMGGDAQLMANIVTFQVLAAAFTLPLFIYIAENL